MDKISVIVPCWNEEESLPLFYQEISRVAGTVPGAEFEFLFVDDGSRDRTLPVLKSLAEADPRCQYLSFSRNFGKEAAMYAGLCHASGDYCVIMDADLQHPPALLPAMYHAVSEEGYDCCAGFREDREGESQLRSFLSRGFYRIQQKLCKLELADGAGDFRMMSRKMVDAVLQLKEPQRYLKGIYAYVGFQTKWLPFHNVERAAGQTKWGFGSLFRYAMEGIFSFSTAPAGWAGAAGVFFLLLTGLLCLIGGAAALLGHSWSGLVWIACLILGMGGVQLCFIGILGQYLARDYLQNKRRPVYIIRESSRQK